MQEKYPWLDPSIISKDVAVFSQWLQCTVMCINQYSVHIIFKPGPKLYIVYWLSYHNHMENDDQEIPGTNINIHTISSSVDISICASLGDIRVATEEDAELQMLKKYLEVSWFSLEQNSCCGF